MKVHLGWFYLAAILCACALIPLKAALSDSGYLTPDSVHYLRAAECCLDGHGFVIPNSGRGVAQSVPFAAWPIGYPALVAAVAALFHLPAFWASKVLNILLLLGCAAVVVRTFRPHGALLSLVLCFGATVEIFSYTWSEAAFIFFLLMFAASCVRVHRDLPGMTVPGIATLLVAGLGLFLSRYIGAFAVGIVVAGSTLCVVTGDRKAAACLGFVALLMASAVVGYLFYNKAVTGFSTGMPRIPAPETSLEFLRMLAAAVVKEGILPLPSWDWRSPVQNAIVGVEAIVLGAVATLTLRRHRQRPVAPREAYDATAIGFVLVGATYLVAIVTARWLGHFDPLCFRLLHPGVLLVSLGLLHGAMQRFEGSRVVPGFITVMAVLSLSFQTWTALLGDKVGNYELATGRRIERYKVIPQGSILITGEIHAYYLRPDLHVLYPMSRPYWDHDETWGSVISGLDRSRRTFVEVSDTMERDESLHPSVRAFICRNARAGLFELTSRPGEAVAEPAPRPLGLDQPDYRK